MRLLKIYIVLAGHFPFRETSENLHCSCRTFPIPWDFWKFTLFLQDISHSVRLLKIYIVLAGHFQFRETSENLHCSCRTFPIPWDFWKFTLFLQDISHSMRLLKIYIVLAGHFPFRETSENLHCSCRTFPIPWDFWQMTCSTWMIALTSFCPANFCQTSTFLPPHLHRPLNQQRHPSQWGFNEQYFWFILSGVLCFDATDGWHSHSKHVSVG